MNAVSQPASAARAPKRFCGANHACSVIVAPANANRRSSGHSRNGTACSRRAHTQHTAQYKTQVANVAQAAVDKGVPSLVRFFGSELARELADDDPQPRHQFDVHASSGCACLLVGKQLP